MLKDPQVPIDGGDLALDNIDDSHAAGATPRATTAILLDYLGKAPSEPLTVADFADLTRLLSPEHPNGDAVVPAGLAGEPGLQRATPKPRARSCGKHCGSSWPKTCSAGSLIVLTGALFVLWRRGLLAGLLG